MRTEEHARRQHDTTFGGLRERNRILNVGQSRPDEHAIRRFDEQFNPHTLESSRDIDARFAQPLL